MKKLKNMEIVPKLKKRNSGTGSKINNLWFTLIEVIIASAILSIAVFWVYKLIWENSKLISNSDNYLIMNNLFINTEECIKSKKSYFELQASWSVENINFWSDLLDCKTWATNWMEINNLEYLINTKITWTWSNFRNFNIKISADWVWNENKNFRLNF